MLKIFKPGKVCSRTAAHIVSRPETGSSWCSRPSRLARCALTLLSTQPQGQAQERQLLALKTFKPGKVCSHTPVHIVSRPGTGNKDSSWCSRSSSLAR